jgi:hypothetical protein
LETLFIGPLSLKFEILVGDPPSELEAAEAILNQFREYQHIHIGSRLDSITEDMLNACMASAWSVVGCIRIGSRYLNVDAPNAERFRMYDKGSEHYREFLTKRTTLRNRLRELRELNEVRRGALPSKPESTAAQIQSTASPEFATDEKVLAKDTCKRLARQVCIAGSALLDCASPQNRDALDQCWDGIGKFYELHGHLLDDPTLNYLSEGIIAGASALDLIVLGIDVTDLRWRSGVQELVDAMSKISGVQP